jgi:uncharacterized protein (DUF1697 family)
MPTHVALLRGVNVGGVKLPMAELRQLATSLGYEEVATYIQSGNLLFTPPRSTEISALGADLRKAIAAEFGIDTPVIVVTRDELAIVIESNPYPDEPKPQYVHGVFLSAEPDQASRDNVEATVKSFSEKGSRDEAEYRGRVLYLHTPDGFGTSELAKALVAKRSSPVATGTARNWATITKLMDLCGG